MKINFEKPKTLEEIITYCPNYKVKLFGKIVFLKEKAHANIIITLKKKTILTEEEKNNLKKMKEQMKKQLTK